MVFYGNRKRFKLLKLTGYLLALLIFSFACFLNMQHEAVRANLFLLFSFVVFFVTFFISKRFETGLLSIGPQGVEFVIGLRMVSIDWDNIEKVELFTFKNRKCLGISMKSIDFAPASLLRIFELNRSETSYHASFEQKSFELCIDDIFSNVSGFLKNPETRSVLSQETEGLDRESNV